MAIYSSLTTNPLMFSTHFSELSPSTLYGTFQILREAFSRRCTSLTGFTTEQTTEIGDKNDHNLTPAKLAAFYKAVGGDYDCKIPIVPGFVAALRRAESDANSTTKVNRH